MVKENSKEKETQNGWNDSNSDYKLYNYKIFYTPDDLGDINRYYKEKLGDPGEFPFTRGPYRTMYKDKLWTMRQYAGFGTAKNNERFKFLLKQEILVFQ
jgi:methylmalonyl-CoA mutase (EC 5.4.99.2)